MTRIFLVPAVLLAGIFIAAAAAPPPLCRASIHEERVELEEAELAVRLARADFAAFEKIFSLIEKLWEREVIERMIYLEAKHERDASRVALRRADQLVARQGALLEQIQEACRTKEENGTGSADPHGAFGRYRKAHCESLERGQEVAAVHLEFQQVLLENIRNLRAGNVVSRQDVIRAELAVERQEIRLKDADQRSSACRKHVTAGGDGGD